MNVLIACEESQTVCKVFRQKGHNAFSCDIQSCSGGHPEWHIQGDVLKILSPIEHVDTENFNDIRYGIQFRTMDRDVHYVPRWDLIIAHPPCTMLAKVASLAFHQNKHTQEDIDEAREFFYKFYNLPGRVCIENPVPAKRAGLPRHSQTVQPYQFGDDWTKLTCLWLKNLPPLIPHCYAIPGQSRNAAKSWVYHKHGSKARSKTFPGIAAAMAEQWG